MGTRADYYIGVGPTAEWLGSIGMDGFPDSHSEPLLHINDEAVFRAFAEAIIKSVDHGTLPDQGWPWPWNNSDTTDYAYMFDPVAKRVRIFGFGRPENDPDYPKITALQKEYDDSQEDDNGEPMSYEVYRERIDEFLKEYDITPDKLFPDMTSLKRVARGQRSGMMILTMGNNGIQIE